MTMPENPDSLVSARGPRRIAEQCDRCYGQGKYHWEDQCQGDGWSECEACSGTGIAQLRLVPLTQREAKDWIRETHRHSGVPHGDIIRVGVRVGQQLVGVGMAGRPVARLLNDGTTLEITRISTNGYDNACSKLYGALNRAAKALGWKSTITYTTDDEDAASVKAAGFKFDATVRAEDSWSRPSRERDAIKRPTGGKTRWRRVL